MPGSALIYGKNPVGIRQTERPFSATAPGTKVRPMHLLRCLALPLALSCAAVDASSQHPIGWRPVSLSVAETPDGAELDAVVYYPAAPDQRGERRVAIAETDGGFPVVVFLHGFGARGGHMVGIGRHLATRGYVAVLTDTTRTGRAKQARNARRFFGALQQENQRDGSFFFGAMDMTRAGLSGHSMGGGNTVRALAENPGYKAGFCFAPWTTPTLGRTGDYVELYAAEVTVPLAIIHGVKDAVLPWKRNAMRLYDALDADTSRIFWVLDDTADHVNVAIPLPWARRKESSSSTTFERCAGMASAFFDHHLKGQPEALRSLLDADDLPEGVLELHQKAPKDG